MKKQSEKKEEYAEKLVTKVMGKKDAKKAKLEGGPKKSKLGKAASNKKLTTKKVPKSK